MGLESKIKDLGKIAVVMGGVSSEREISLKSGKAVFDAFKRHGFNAVAVDLVSENPDEVAQLIRSQNPDCIFLALHGHFGEDGGIQTILDGLKIPYTGSGAKASKLAMDKAASRKIFEAGGLNVPQSKVLLRQESSIEQIKNLDIPLPAVIKPAANGSSIGLSIIDNMVDLDRAIMLGFKFDDTIIIERFIEGRELTVGILADNALPVIEIVPK
ncbi:ATP-grasp domain-containing protein, partial [bacterium]